MPIPTDDDITKYILITYGIKLDKSLQEAYKQRYEIKDNINKDPYITCTYTINGGNNSAPSSGSFGIQLPN